MSRNGAGIYSLPPIYEAIAGETILATQHNTPLVDLEADANGPRPVVAGGTGASTQQGAISNLFTSGSEYVKDDKFFIADPADPTKKVRIDAGNVATGTTRVLTMPNANVDLTEISFSASKGGVTQTGVGNAQVTFGTSIFNAGGYYSTSTSRFTPPAGKYRLSARVLVSTNITDQSAYLLKIRKNGSDWVQSQVRASGTSGFSINVTDVVDSNGTDYWDVLYFSGSGAQDIEGSYINTAFQGERI